MFVFIDANVLFEENSQNTVLFKTLLRLCTTQGFELCLPHITMLEAERLYVDRINKYNADLDALLQFGTTARVGAGALTEVVLDRSALVDQFYAARQNSGMTQQPCIHEIPNLPQDRHEAIARTLVRRRPSKYRDETEKVKGTVNARDTLFWLALLRFLATKEGKAVLITSDSDFYDTNLTTIHRQLAQDIAQTAPRIEFSIFKTLSGFLSTVPELLSKEREVVEAQAEYQQASEELWAVRRVQLEISDQEVRINWRIRFTGEGLIYESMKAQNERELGVEPEVFDVSSHPKMLEAWATVEKELQELRERYPLHSERHQAANQRFEAATARLEEAKAASAEAR